MATEWQQAFERFEAYRILYEADDQWGPLAEATMFAEIARGGLRYGKTEAERADRGATYEAATDTHERTLRHHMDAIYNPLIEAALALVRTPAPDLAAVAIKHAVCGANFEPTAYEETEGELFGLIRADIERLTGIVA